MRTVHDARQLGHAGHEIAGGRLAPSVECPRRAEVVLEALADAGLGEVVEPEPRAVDAVRRLHAADYLEFLERAYGDWERAHGPGEGFPLAWPKGTAGAPAPASIEGRLGHYAFAMDTPITRGAFAAATAAAGVAAAAARMVADGEPAVFALCRPPGHHAGRATYGGYCFLNNAAVAAQTLRDRGAARVAILDVDLHHGNGTQELFYARGDVLTVSLHADPDTTFPYFWGRADERGAGDGEGANRNLPLPTGTKWRPYREALRAALREIERAGAEALVVSLGLDTFVGDPFATFGLTTADFGRLGQELRTGRPTVFVLEGGYALDELGHNAVAVLSGFES